MLMSKKLDLLLIEPSPDDAQQVLNKLAQVYELQCRQAVDLNSIQAILSAHVPDIVLCTHDLPSDQSLQALRLVQALESPPPFLFLANDSSEKNITNTMQAGADDYLCKKDLGRLIPTVAHNLREAEIHRAHRKAQAELQENQARLHAFISNLPGMACQIMIADEGGMHFPYVGEGSWALLGLSPQELEKNATLFLKMLHPNDRTSYYQVLKNAVEQFGFWNWEGRIVMPETNEIKWINLRGSPRLLANGNTQWEGVIFNITQSKLAEMELSQSQEELRALSLHIQDVREQERLNISREVHDNLGGLLTAIKLELARMRNQLPPENPKALETARGLEELVDKCIVSASNISRTLRPGVLDCFGIVAAIEMEIEEFRKRTDITCEFTDIDEGEELDPELDIALFRIFQETLTNIIKHAQATHIDVDIRNQKHGISLTVHDNGRGLSEADKHKPHSFGLRGIKERVAYLGGEFKIDGAPGHGTTISISIPRHPHSGSMAENPQQPLFRNLGSMNND